MGKAHSKIIHSISANFNVLNKRGDERKDSSELSLVKVRSTSLESISTAVSFGTGQPHPLSHTHSSSVDNLQCADSNSAHFKSGFGDSSVTACTGSGQRYTLLNSSSVVSSTTALTEEEEEEGEIPSRGFTQSLPAEIERKINVRSKVVPNLKPVKRDDDCFSDNFVSFQDSEMLSGVDAESARLPSSTSQNEDTSIKVLPNLPPSLLRKLSPEEWSDFITFVCATLDQSLRTSLTDKHCDSPKSNTAISRTGSPCQTGSPGQTGSRNCHSKHVQISKRIRQDSCEHDEEMWSRKHGRCDSRPSSLPSLHLRDNPSLTERLQALAIEAGQEVSVANCQQDVVRSRSKSQDDCYHNNWSGQHCHQSGPSNHDHRHHHHHGNGRRGHRSGQRRRRRNERLEKERNSRVDVSLDDNCPGLPQNRVSRRGRQHVQTTVCCHRCLDRLGDSYSPTSSSSRRYMRESQLGSPSGERTVVDGNCEMTCSSGSGSRDEGEIIASESLLTLQDMKKATSDFLKGTNELDESVIQDLKVQFLLGMAEQQRHNAKLVTRKSDGNGVGVQLDAIQPWLSRNRPRTKSLHLSTSNRWHQRAFPTEVRTGQDSPRTDMAVFNLDLNSPRMCQPIVLSDPTSIDEIPMARTVEGGSHLYVHKHHHIHHIIHHSQP